MFMTVREVADLTRVSEATVRHWIKDGDLRAIDVGREFRIIPRDLEAFLERHATAAARAADDSGRKRVAGSAQLEQPNSGCAVGSSVERPPIRLDTRHSPEGLG
jgi:excisionase family DNA binding protein